MNRRQFIKTTAKSATITTLAFSAIGLTSCGSSGTSAFTSSDVAPYWGKSSFKLSGTDYNLNFELRGGGPAGSYTYYVTNNSSTPFTWGNTTLAPGSTGSANISENGNISF